MFLCQVLSSLYTPFTLQVVSPPGRPHLVKRPCPWMFKISCSGFSTVGMCRCFRACEFHTVVTEGVVHGGYKVVIWLSFGETRRHKVSGGIGHFTTCSSDGYWRWVEVNWGCFSVTNICSTVVLLLLMVTHPCPISGCPPVVWTAWTK